MLRKLFKHDVIAMGRAVAPIALGFPAVSLLAWICHRVTLGAGNTLETTAAVLAVVLPLAGFVALFATLMVNSIIQFQKSLLMGESYLTHTIPAAMEQILLSKLLAVILWFLLAVLSAVIALSPFFTSDSGETSLLSFLISKRMVQSLPKLFILLVVIPSALWTYMGMAVSLTGVPRLAERKWLKGLAPALVLIVTPWAASMMVGAIMGPEYKVVRTVDGAGFHITLDQFFGRGLYTTGAVFAVMGICFFFITAYVLKHFRTVTSE